MLYRKISLSITSTLKPKKYYTFTPFNHSKSKLFLKIEENLSDMILILLLSIVSEHVHSKINPNVTT